MRRRLSRFARRKVKPYDSEEQMCELLRLIATDEGFTVYPETGDWDMILVRPADGFQVGVQAKQQPNVDVLAQTLVGDRAKGPDVHAVLVPSCSRAFSDVAGALKVLVIEASVLDPERQWRWARPVKLSDMLEKAPRRVHLPGRCWLPPFVPKLPAGVPGPRQVTPWKIFAAELCAKIRKGEEVSNGSARALRLDVMRLELVPGSKPRLYRVPSGTRLPDVDFPEVAEGLGLPVPTTSWA